MKPRKSRTASGLAGDIGNVISIERSDRATRSQSVTDALREAILNGEFAPGEHIQEVPLSERLRVSRTPVRAALQSLAVANTRPFGENPSVCAVVGRFVTNCRVFASRTTTCLLPE